MRLAIRTTRLELAAEGATAVDEPYLMFDVLRRSDGVRVGRCGFPASPDARGVVGLEYAFDAEHAGHGYEAEALEALVGYAFTRDEVVSVRASAPSGDQADRRLLERAGMMAVSEEDGWIHFEA